MRLGDWVSEVRNSIVARPAFQRFAARFPLTRPIATRQSAQVFDLCAGFVYSQILAAFVALDLLEMLRNHPQEAAAIGTRTGLSPERATRLLRAGAALGLAEKRGDNRFGLGLKGAALLGNPGALRMVRHHALFYADLADPVALLREPNPGRALAQFWTYAGPRRAEEPQKEERHKEKPADSAAYSALMAETLSLLVEDLLASYPFARHRHVLDVGGGSGAFIRALANRAPNLDFTLFDLPAVAENIAPQAFAQAGSAARVRFAAGDARLGPLPSGADLITLIRVLHDHDDDAASGMLRAIHAALPPGGQLLIAEPMTVPGAERVADAYFGFYLLAMGSGRARQPAEIEAMLREAGFRSVRILAMPRPILASALLAERGEA